MAAHPAVATKDLMTALHELVEADLDAALPTELAEVLVELLGCATRLDAVVAEVAARVDASKVWANDGSTTCAGWLGRAAHRDRSECAAVLRRGRQLRDMPLAEEVHLAGRISARHVRMLAAARTAAPESYADDEAWLVARACELSFADFAKVINYWRQCAAPDDAEHDALARYRKRRLNMGSGLDGTGFADVAFEPIGYATFSEALRRIERELWEADWADARQRLGPAATKADLDRSDAQRRYDALIEMARRSAAGPADARTPRPLVTVHVDHETLVGRVCELSTGTVVTPGEVLPLLVDADLERAVFDTPSRLLDLGRAARFFAGGTRRAVEITRPKCAHGTCQIPSELCDIHHTVPWERGGPTIQDNGEPRCPTHHREAHRSHRSAPPPRRTSTNRTSTGRTGDDPHEPGRG